MPGLRERIMDPPEYREWLRDKPGLRKCLRRFWWVGFFSAWDLSGQHTRRAWQRADERLRAQLAREA